MDLGFSQILKTGAYVEVGFPNGQQVKNLPAKRQETQETQV